MTLKSTIMGLAFILIWSSAFSSAKIIVSHSPPLFALGARFLITGLFGLAISGLLIKTSKISKNEWHSLCLFGLCQNSIYLGLNFKAMENIDAFLAVIIASLLPVFVSILAWTMRIEKLNSIGILGLVLGIVGCWSILYDKLLVKTNITGLILCIIGVLALAAATLLLKNTISKKNQILKIVSLQMLVGGAPLLVVSYFFEAWFIDISLQFSIAFIYTCLFPGLVATMLWFLLVNEVGPVRAATFHFLNPPTGTIIAWLILGEFINKKELIGIVLLVFSIILINTSKSFNKASLKNLS